MRALGEGSHGVVMLVEHTRLAKPFVMKLIQQKFLANKDVVARFIAEAQRGAKLNHEAFAPIVDLGETQDGRTYFVMEYVEGITLQQALRDRGAFPLDRALVLGLQLLDGLAAAHDAHLIHRDIKPANLFLTTRGRLKILDLGISKSIIDSGTGPNTAHGVAIGTPKYMSPEQAKGRPVSFATDLYSVALILFELLTGVAAFESMSAQELLRHHIFTPAPTLAERSGRTFPPALEALIACALRKEPAERFQTAREMQAALHAILESSRTELPGEQTRDESARPTVRVVEAPPPQAFPTEHRRVPSSTDALRLGAASTEKQVVGTQPANATAPTTALDAMTGAPPIETAGATTRTHDVQASKRPGGVLVAAAAAAGLALILASAAALIWVIRGGPVGHASLPPPTGAPSMTAPTAAPIASGSAIASVHAPVSASATASTSASVAAVGAKAAPPKPKGASHYQAAVEAMNAGDLETADTEARLAVASGGGTQAQLLHAQILEQRGKKAAAREIYHQILEKDPTMATAVAGLKRCGG